MKYVIADTSIWIGAFVKNDKWHENGKRFLNWLNVNDDICVVLPIGVMYEVIAGILNKPHVGFYEANRALDLFINDERIAIHYNTEDSFLKAIKIFKQYRKLSLVDSTIVIFYFNKKCSFLFSTDEHYDSIPEINSLKFPIAGLT